MEALQTTFSGEEHRNSIGQQLCHTLNLSIFTLLVGYFRCQVGNCSGCTTPKDLVGFLSESEVRELDVAILENKKILQLEIPIDNPVAVQNFQSANHASGDKSDCSLPQSLKSLGSGVNLFELRSVGEQVAQGRVLHNQVLPVIVRKTVVHLDQKGATECPHYQLLEEHTGFAKVRGLFRQELHRFRIFGLIRFEVCSPNEIDFPESSSTQQTELLVVVDASILANVGILPDGHPSLASDCICQADIYFFSGVGFPILADIFK